MHAVFGLNMVERRDTESKLQDRAMKPPDVGDRAPDAVLVDDLGATRSLSEFWRDRPLALFFERHLGCPLCREHVADLQRDLPLFDRAGVQVVAITMGNAKQAAAFHNRYQLSFPCLADDAGKAYQAFGLSRGGIAAVALPHLSLAGLMTVARYGVGVPIGDPRQLPGAFVIDRSGIIRLAHRGRDAGDMPDHELAIGAASDTRVPSR